MILKYVQAVRNALQILKNGFNPEPLLLLNGLESNSSKAASISIQELMGDGFLWGVPKKKPTVQRRIRDRFGHPRFQNVTRLIQPRQDLVICENCGDHHEVFAICRTCYERVKLETDEIKKDIAALTDRLAPKEKDIRLKYEDESKSEEDFKDFKIVDIPRKRPSWFAPNLLSKGSGSSSTTNKSPTIGNDSPIIETYKK